MLKPLWCNCWNFYFWLKTASYDRFKLKTRPKTWWCNQALKYGRPLNTNPFLNTKSSLSSTLWYYVNSFALEDFFFLNKRTLAVVKERLLCCCCSSLIPFMKMFMWLCYNRPSDGHTDDWPCDTTFGEHHGPIHYPPPPAQLPDWSLQQAASHREHAGVR